MEFTTKDVDKDSQSSVNCDVLQGWVVVLVVQQFLSERRVSATITCNGSYWDLLEVWSIIMEKQFTTKDVDKDSQSSVNCALCDRVGWWYWSCSSSYLNNVYLQLQQSRVTDITGIYWRNWV